MSTSHEICTPGQQLDCSLSTGSLSIKQQQSATFEFYSISSSPPSTPTSPSAPPLSPITPKEDGNNWPTCVPINKVTSHSQLPQPINSLFPPNFSYIFKKCTPLNNYHEAFNTNFYINIKTEDEAKEWISKFEQEQTQLTI